MSDERVTTALQRAHVVGWATEQAVASPADDDRAVLASEVARLQRLHDAVPPYRMADWTPAELAALLLRDRAILAAARERWAREWRRTDTILTEIQTTADGGGMVGHDGAEDIRRFRLISDLVNRIWDGDTRETMIRYLIGTQALSGVTVSREDAEAAVDVVYAEPLIELAGAREEDV